LEKSEIALVGSDMIGPQPAAHFRIRTEVDAGEGAEFVGKVGLIVEAAIEGDFGPWDFSTGGHLAHCTLKSYEPAPGLRREPNLLTEDLGKSPLAPARAARHLGHASHDRAAPKPVQRKLYGWMQSETGALKTGQEVGDQKLLEQAYALLWRSNLAQAVAQSTALSTPNLLERNVLVAEQIGAIGYQGGQNGGLKHNADQVREIGSIDNLVNGALAYDQSGCGMLLRQALRTVEQEIP
jgi:hypothetical protein